MSGTKNDAGKPRYDLIAPEALDALAGVLAIGAKKYGDRNWERGLDYGRVFAALQRHAWAWWGGEEFDKVDGQHHLDSVMWCAMVLRTFIARGTGTDDRVGPQGPLDSYADRRPLVVDCTSGSPRGR